MVQHIGLSSEITAYHKDLEIRGTIGEAYPKGKLSYKSLLKQIEEEN